MNILRNQIAVGVLIAFGAFAVYVLTLCPTVDFIDSGELAADAYLLGIPHPTGYPMFMLAGYVFSHLPLGLRPIVNLNLMAAVFCAAGLFVFYRWMLSFLENLFPGNSGRRAPVGAKWHYVVPASAAAISLGFSETYWSQGVAVEVYSLHLLFLSTLLLLFTGRIAGLRGAEADISQDQRKRALFAFVLGLAFANHMTTILLAPAFLVAYFAVCPPKELSTWKHLVQMSVPFVAGLSMYLILPWRASEHPLMNWGNPKDLEHILWHVSGKQYRVWMFSSVESAEKQFSYFVTSLPEKFGYLLLALGAFGLAKLSGDGKTVFRLLAQAAGGVALFFLIGALATSGATLAAAGIVLAILAFCAASFILLKENPVLLFTILLFETCIIYSINYDIHDIDSYFLLADVVIAVWCGFGALSLWESGRRAGRAGLAGAGLAFVCLSGVYFNYHDVDESKTTIVEDYTRDMFNSVEKDGVVLSYQWDYFVSAAYYLQLVEKVRTDIVVVDKELLRRSWYLDQLGVRYPWLAAMVRPEMDAFRIELLKFERGEKYNGEVIEGRYAALIRALLDRNLGTRAVYVGPEIEPQYLAGFHKVPSGLLFRLWRGENMPKYRVPTVTFRRPVRSDKYVEGVIGMYAQALLNCGISANLEGDREKAVEYINKSLEIRPDFPEAISWKMKLGAN